jgi:hypothetical protein
MQLQRLTPSEKLALSLLFLYGIFKVIDYTLLVALNRSKETFPGMTRIDTRQVVGSYVHMKALHVTNKAKYARHYGSQAKSKMLLGTVVNVTSSVTQSRHMQAPMSENELMARIMLQNKEDNGVTKAPVSAN